MEPCTHPDYDWFNPDINSNDPMDEVLACTECGHVRWTAREVTKAEAVANRLTETMAVCTCGKLKAEHYNLGGSGKLFCFPRLDSREFVKAVR